MADYQLTATDATVIRTLDAAYIPNDPANRDYVEYQDWFAAGGVPDPYVIPPLTRQQEADAHLTGGLTVTSTSLPILNGTYGVVMPDSININSIATAFNTTGAFPNVAVTVQIFDKTGGPHSFSTKTFPGFVRAVRDFVHNCHLYGQGTRTGLPPNAVSIDAYIQPVERLDLDSASEVLHDHENRIRALEGQAPLTLGDFIAKMDAQQ